MTFNPFLPDKAAAAPTGPLTLATVGAVSAEGVTLILPGATEPTQAHYPNFSSSSLASGDSVIISRVSGTWVVMGKAGGGGGGGGGTSDYNDLSNKPSINGNTLSGNKTAAQLGLGTYSKPSGGIPKSDLASAVQTSLGKADSALQSVPSTYRTAAAQDAIDAAQDAEIGIVITGKRPSMSVTAGQYVIVRNSTISGITDGLYIANAALSPSTDVTAANLMAVSNGGLNSLKSQIEDSGWIDLTLTSDFQLFGASAKAQYRKIGNLVFVVAQVKPTSEITASANPTSVAILPEGFRPTIGITYVCQGSGMNRFCLQIDPSGSIGISRYGTTALANIPTNAWLPFNALYFTV